MWPRWGDDWQQHPIKLVVQVVLYAAVVAGAGWAGSAFWGQPFTFPETFGGVLVVVAGVAALQIAFARLESLQRRIRYLERQTGHDTQAKHEVGQGPPPGN